MMTAKILAMLLLVPLTLMAGVQPHKAREIYVKAGELVVLHCPRFRGHNHVDAKPAWICYTTHDADLTNNMSLAGQRQMGMLVNGRSLVILAASANNQGNYSCSLGNASRRFWFRLTVYTSQTREYEERTKYSMKCYTQDPCILRCPDVNTPAVTVQNMTSNDIIWHKDGVSSPGYFSSVEESNHGIYTCTRSYLYNGQTYNMTITLELDVQPKKKSRKPVILSPHEDDEFHVALGSTVVIDCKAVLHSNFDEVFWLKGELFVETNNSLPVFCNYTWSSDSDGGEIKMTASLVIKKVSEEDLSKQYTCKLESTSEPSSFVTINLAQKAVAEAVSDCIEQSRAVVLVPTSSDACQGSDLSAIHAALVKQQTCFVFSE